MQVMWFSFLFFLNWGIVDLQCYVSFSCMQSYLVTYILFTYNISIFFFRFSSIIDYYKKLGIVLCAIQCYTTSLCFLFYIWWYLSVNPILLIYHSPLLPLWWPYICFLCLWVYFCVFKFILMPYAFLLKTVLLLKADYNPLLL